MPTGQITLIIHGVEIYSEPYNNATERRLFIWMWKSTYAHFSYKIKPNEISYSLKENLSPNARHLIYESERKTDLLFGEKLTA